MKIFLKQLIKSAMSVDGAHLPLVQYEGYLLLKEVCFVVLGELGTMQEVKICILFRIYHYVPILGR